MSMRQQVLREIVSSEQSYVEDLNRLVMFFMSPLQRLAATSDAALDAAQIATIFGSVDQLLDFNRKLQAQLEEAVQGAATPDEACVGDIFHNFGPYLKMYSAYVDKHADALKALDVAEESSASFRAFLTNIYALNTVRGQTLRSFLIMPVQRVPRYRLLLKELRKHTPDTHPDAPALDRALQHVETAATHINEGIRRRENREKILEIQEDEGVSLVTPGRVFLKEGTLNKLCRRGFKPFKFYLFNDLLLYCGAGQFGRSNRSIPLKSVSTADTGSATVKKSARGSFMVGSSSAGGGSNSTAGGQYAYTEKVAGDRMSTASGSSRDSVVLAGDDDEDEPQSMPRGGVASAARGPSDSVAASTKDVDPTKSFLLKSSTKSFIVQGSSPDDAAAWRSAIMGAAVQSRRSASSRGLQVRRVSQDETAAPVWEVDSEVNDCRLCGLRFSMISRKHHCRNCGTIVCGPCSPYRWPLPAIDPDKPARVCTECYTTLAADGSAGGGAASSSPAASSSSGAGAMMSNLGRRLSVGLKDAATRIRNASLGSSSPAEENAAQSAAAPLPEGGAGGLEDDYIPHRRRSLPRRKPSVTPADGYTDIDAAVAASQPNSSGQVPPPLPPRSSGPPPVPERPSAKGGGGAAGPPPVPARPVEIAVEPSASHRRRSSSVHRADFDRVTFEPVVQGAVTPKGTPASRQTAPQPAPAVAASPVSQQHGDTGEVPGAGANVFLEEHPPVRPTDEASLPTSFLYGCVVAGDFDVEGLPENWFAAGDEASARVYYFNDVTEETTWAPPPGSDPTLVATTVVKLPREWSPRRTPDGRLFFVKEVSLPRGAPAPRGFKSQWALPVGSTKLRSFETNTSAGAAADGRVPDEVDDVVSRVGAIGVRIIKDVTGSPSHGDVAGNYATQRQAVGVQVLGGGPGQSQGFDVDYHADPASATLLESNTSLAQYKENKIKREKRLSELQMTMAASGRSAPEAGKTSAPLRSMVTGGGAAPKPVAKPVTEDSSPAEAVQRSVPPVPPPPLHPLCQGSRRPGACGRFKHARGAAEIENHGGQPHKRVGPGECARHAGAVRAALFSCETRQRRGLASPDTAAH